jgi:excisionase family DNA binding protein
MRAVPSLGKERLGSSKRAQGSTNLDPRHTGNPPDSCLSRLLPNGRRNGCGEGSTAPPGGRLWHGFAVRRPPVGRGGRGLTFGLFGGNSPMQRAAVLDIGGMERKSSKRAFYTERSLAEFLAVSDRTVRNWIRRGELPSYKLGASRRFSPADVEAFLARHRDEAS